MVISMHQKIMYLIVVMFMMIGSSWAMTDNRQHKEFTLSTAGVVEIVIYTTKEGVSQAGHLKKATEAGCALVRMDGFVGRHFTRDTDGKWIDLVYWRDMASAKHAADIFVTLPESQAFMADMNESNMQFIHTSILSSITE